MTLQVIVFKQLVREREQNLWCASWRPIPSLRLMHAKTNVSIQGEVAMATDRYFYSFFGHWINSGCRSRTRAQFLWDHCGQSFTLDFLAIPYFNYLSNLSVSVDSRRHVSWTVPLFLGIRKEIPTALRNSIVLS
jgi:hypothetical protein